MVLSKRKLEIVIPTLDSELFLPRLLKQLAGYKVLVVDGGSTDKTEAISKQEGAHILRTEAGRGHQLALGARQSSAEWLLFLHSDSRFGEGWEAEVAHFIEAEHYKLAVFRFSLDDSRFAARMLERLVEWRCDLFGLPYGDQGLLIHRNAYLDAGGFQALPLMEDVALIRKFSRKEIFFLRTKLITSSARFQERGYFFQMVRNVVFLLLYFAGISPQRLARFY